MGNQSVRNVYIATLFELLGLAGWLAPCALRVSNQSGKSYTTVAMEYAKGKISARGREISCPVTWDTRVRWDISIIIKLIVINFIIAGKHIPGGNCSRSANDICVLHIS